MSKHDDQAHANDDAVVDPEEDLALTRKPDGEVAIMDAALGDWSTSPDLRNDAAGVDRAGQREDEASSPRTNHAD